MDEFQIYIVESKVFGDTIPDKRRPSVYIGLSSEKFGYVCCLEFILIKKNLIEKIFWKECIKIQDKDIVHVNSKEDSYIDVSSEIVLSLAKVRELANTQVIGRLSEKDIIGLIAKYNAYKL